MKIYFGNTAFECDAVAFDKDGTLIDRSAFWWGLYEGRRALLLQHQQGEAIVRTYEQMLGVDRSRRAVDLHGPLATASLSEEQVVLTTAIYQATHSPWDRAREWATDILAKGDGNLPPSAYASPLPGVPGVLLELAAQGLPLAVLTGDYAERTHQTLLQLGLKEAVRCVVCPSDVANAKPAPDMIFHAAQHLGVEPTRVAVVGDTLVDLQMAQAAGSFAVAALAGSTDRHFADGLAGAIIDSIAEIRIADD